MLHADSHFLKILLGQIEAQLAWGSSDQWTNYDFENLSDIVPDKTSVNLSTTTLKRIWGRVKYENDPAVATLNTIAQFAGYTDWRRFKINQIEPPVTTHKDILVKVTNPSMRTIQKKFYWLGGVAVMLLVSYLLISSIKTTPYINPANFQFKANKVLTLGVPNSVIFTYDARASKSDSVYIVQTWDIRRKTLVSKNGTNHSAIYYYPCYFRTKLIVDNTIVKTHDLQIGTDGWLGMVEGEKPFYFSKNEIKTDEGISISNELLLKNNFSLSPNLPAGHFYNQRDMGDLMNNNFEFETKIRNDYVAGTHVCQFTEVLIQCKDDISLFHFVLKPV